MSTLAFHVAACDGDLQLLVDLFDGGILRYNKVIEAVDFEDNDCLNFAAMCRCVDLVDFLQRKWNGKSIHGPLYGICRGEA